MVEHAAVRAHMHVPLQAGCYACVPGSFPASLHACACMDDSAQSVLSACAESPRRHARREVRFVQREVGSGTGIGPVPHHHKMTIRAASTSVRRASDAFLMDWRCGRTLRWTFAGPVRVHAGARTEPEAWSESWGAHSMACCVRPTSRSSLLATSTAPHVPSQVREARSDRFVPLMSGCHVSLATDPWRGRLSLETGHDTARHLAVRGSPHCGVQRSTGWRQLPTDNWKHRTGPTSTSDSDELRWGDWAAGYP